MTMTRVALYGALLCSLLVGPVAVGQPEPSPVGVTWELKFEPTPPMRIVVAGKTYWYMLYTVTNNTGEDINFHPEIVRVNEIESELPAEQAKAQPQAAPQITVDPAIVGLHSNVFREIQTRHKRTHPFLKTPVNAIGKLLQGADNALTSVAVFSDLDPRVSKFTIYITGLSGEVLTKPNPMYDPRRASGGKDKTSGDESNPRAFVLRKTLAIPYTLPGDVRTRRIAEPKLGRMTWVMR
ncbi:MAG: hypothetical protein JXQ75_16165 [Phycisphaerae bacterium]|nr:hypothetical protein [Phycisphaerae bacterium]